MHACDFCSNFAVRNQKSNTMKRLFIFLLGLMTAVMLFAAGINYDGTNLTMNNEFTRTQCGTSYKNTMKEISGLACSRTTPGYLWAHGDENTGSNKKIIAIQPSGTLAMTLNISGDPGRDDWEDIATGVYNNQNYVFIGAFGDNDHAFNDQYYIYYFVEPAITSGTKSVSVDYIKFGYPDNTAHNTETLLYDNIDQMIYIVDKVDGGACAIYQLPFRTDYGTGVQRLTKICDLGTGNKFELCCGGDISPDGKWMGIKNRKYVLLWERQGTESLATTVTRRPVQIAAYEEETQGESLAWKDSTTFYTTSDSKKDTPIYMYVRAGGSSQGGDDPTPEDPPVEPDPVDSTAKAINEVVLSNGYYAYINSGETVIRGWYVGGTEMPTVRSTNLSEGETWSQTGNDVTITALDGSTATYTMDIQPVTPVAFSTDEIVCNGTEGDWIKSAYGWDSSKKWRFSKTDDDYSREIAGKTHVELFLPACDTVVIKSMSTQRDVRFYINGEVFGSKTKLLTSGNALAVNQTEAFMLTVASAQSSGDGGIAAVRMARKGGTTDMRSIEATRPAARKILRNGQLLIEHQGWLITVTGQAVR